MVQKIWLNGSLVDQENAKVSVLDHGLLYGDGVFEGIRVYSGKIFREKQHIDRLYSCAKYIRLNIKMSKEEMIDAMHRTVEANEVTDGYIRLVVSRGAGTLGLNPFHCPEPTVFIIAANIQLYPEELYENGLSVVSSSYMRNPTQCVPPQVKSLNYLNNILAKIEAIDNDVLEAIMYNSQGYVAEATGDNVFIVKDNIVCTPPVQAGSLNGITRQVVLELAEQAEYKTVEKNLTRFDLYSSDEMFLTGTAAEVIGVVKIDGRIIGDGSPGPITKDLRKRFYTCVNE
ncbi:branched-chain-amino-acid transaminase [Sedimentisphaera salicampi]|uniref:Branched-chain-amino-acid aminotransferase n=1 Tax=Sedimentisphaera salicampi TaxID=1941349 RepID=A0A1W6LIS6_9BACT|nr:branched-chain-amino-acid transaminase [Sedimentisphaera salicampi]ARN55646.1 Branched-chain-amino-acid aminotransferase [Sedimentisphaera salicampi]OXU16165.1 Branched-chain-amino-acid aminotransferase [Sedimentisphaera salicampi]